MNQNNERYRLLIENIPDAFAYHRIVNDDEGKPVDLEFLEVNGAFEKVTGHKKSIIIGKKLTDLVTGKPDFHHDMIDACARVASNGKSISFEKYFDTLKKWYEITIFSDKPGYFAAVFHDISDRKRVEEELKESQKRLYEQKYLLESIMDNAPIGIWLVDLDQNPVLVNKFFEENTGFGSSNPSMKEEEIAICKITDEIALDSDTPRQFEEKVTFKDGCKHILQTMKTKLYNEDGNILGILGLGVDITDWKETEKALQFQLKFEKMVSDISSYLASLASKEIDQGINYALKLTGEFFKADRSYVFLFSEDMKEMSNTHEWCAEGIEPQINRIQDYPVEKLPWFSRQIKTREYVCIYDIDNLLPEAEAEQREFKAQGIVSLLCIPMFKDGALFGFLGFDVVRGGKIWTGEQVVLLKVVAELVSNVLERYQADEKIRYLSFYDSLTNLYNRSYLEEEMKRLDTTRQLPISIIMADLNGLKLVNDTYGHCVGDTMLKRAAETLKESCRQEDIIARWGGDEFVILLPKTSREEAWAISNRIALKSSEICIEDIPVSMALGVSSKDNPEKSLPRVLKEAEDNMYKHKLTESRSGKSGVLNALIKALEEKSYETEIHTRNMQKIALEIGKEVGLPDSELDRLKLLVKLHDIGKINLPEEVLVKKGPLTEKEWEIIKRHPETGYRIARATEAFAHVAEDIFSHHERWDGRGYPRGLKGEEIPLLARITAIADTYEVMINGRPYKKALPHEEVIAEIKRCAGTQFDPELVEVFLSILERECVKGGRDIIVS